MPVKLETTLRRLGPDDLEQANAVVEAALMTWSLPERVKRLSLPAVRALTDADPAGARRSIHGTRQPGRDGLGTVGRDLGSLG